MRFIYIVLAALLLGFAFAAVRQENSLSDLYIAFSGYEHELDERAHNRADRDQELSIHGMEPETCGFHVVTPPYNGFADSYLNSVATSDTDRFAFSMISHFRAEDYPLDAMWDIQASHERIFPNGVASLGLTIVDGEYALEAHFTSRGLRVIRSVHGPTDSSSPYRDWFSRSNVNGGPSSIMHAALVYNDVAFTPVNVTEMLRTGDSTAIVARGLTASQAEDILDAFER